MRSAAPAAGDARLMFTMLWLDRFRLSEVPARLALNGVPLIRRSPITGKTIWLVPGPKTAPFDLPAGEYVFTLLGSAGDVYGTSPTVVLEAGTVTEVVMYGAPQHIATAGTATRLSDIPPDKELLRVLNLTGFPMHVVRCASHTACAAARDPLAPGEAYEELAEIGTFIRVDVVNEDGERYSPLVTRADHGGHIVSGFALWPAPPPIECRYLCDPGIIHTSFVADADLDP